MPLDQQFSHLADIGGDRVSEVLAREHLSSRVGELSGEQKRRLQLLLLLLSEPDLIALDEPTNDVDVDVLIGRPPPQGKGATVSRLGGS